MSLENFWKNASIFFVIFVLPIMVHKSMKDQWRIMGWVGAGALDASAAPAESSVKKISPYLFPPQWTIGTRLRVQCAG